MVGAAWAALKILALAYGGYVLVVFALQRSIVFPGASRDAGSVVPTGVEEMWLELPFGRVEAWYMGAGPEAPVAIFAHGNGELIGDWHLPMQRLREYGVSVLLVEYPGYGRSEGRPSRSSIRAVFEAAWDRMRADAGGGRPIVAMGRSLGGGAASDLTRTRPVDALVLMSTFSASADVAWRVFRVPSVAVRDRFDVRAAVAAYRGPILLLHGTRDDVLPFDNAVRIAEAREGLDIVPLECGHNDCLGVWPETVETVAAFLRAAGLLGERAGP